MLLVMKPEEARKISEDYSQRCEFDIKVHAEMVKMTNARITKSSKRGGRFIGISLSDYLPELYEKNLIPTDLNANESQNYLNKLVEVFRLAGYKIEEDRNVASIYTHRISW